MLTALIILQVGNGNPLESYLQVAQTFGAVTHEPEDWTFNVELDELSDYTSSMTQSIAVPLSRRLSLKVALKWLYNSVPALEDVDVVAQVVLLDPDGIPGNGDELFETVASGGVEIELGSVRERRKERLDAIFTTSLAIEF